MAPASFHAFTTFSGKGLGRSSLPCALPFGPAINKSAATKPKIVIDIPNDRAYMGPPRVRGPNCVQLIATSIQSASEVVVDYRPDVVLERVVVVQQAVIPVSHALTFLQSAGPLIATLR